MPTPILDFLIFNKMSAIVGGKIRLLLSGGAPLAPDTHDFVRCALDLPLVQVILKAILKFKVETAHQNLRLINGRFTTLSSHFFANYMNIFHKTEVQRGLNLIWFKNYDPKCKYFRFRFL